jgi:transcription elongation factor GreB
MSRAFLKDDANQERVLVPQRAPLPEGVPNLVTPAGLAALETEHEALVARRARLQEAGEESAGEVAVLHERIRDLRERVASARVVHPPAPGSREVRLGATVEVAPAEGEAGAPSRVHIVGVDEADPLEGRVAFTAPIAAALLGRHVGEVVPLRAGGQDRSLRILNVRYQTDDGPPA